VPFVPRQTPLRETAPPVTLANMAGDNRMLALFPLPKVPGRPSDPNEAWALTSLRSEPCPSRGRHLRSVGGVVEVPDDGDVIDACGPALVENGPDAGGLA